MQLAAEPRRRRAAVPELPRVSPVAVPHVTSFPSQHCQVPAGLRPFASHNRQDHRPTSGPASGRSEAEMPQKGPQSCPASLGSLQLHIPFTSSCFWESYFETMGINFNHTEAVPVIVFPSREKKHKEKQCATKC